MLHWMLSMLQTRLYNQWMLALSKWKYENGFVYKDENNETLLIACQDEINDIWILKLIKSQELVIHPSKQNMKDLNFF